MESINPTATSLLVAVTVLACSIFVFDRVLGVKRSAHEPPYISPKVPVVGHVVGLLRYKFDYYIDLRYDCSPIMLVEGINCFDCSPVPSTLCRYILLHFQACRGEEST